MGSFQVDEWSQPRRVLVPDVLDLGIGSPVIGYVLSLKRLPPRLVVFDLGIGSPVIG